VVRGYSWLRMRFMSVNLFEERSEEPLNIRLKKMHRLWMLICFVAFPTFCWGLSEWCLHVCSIDLIARKTYFSSHLCVCSWLRLFMVRSLLACRLGVAG
jgi:hypothetical protein